LKSTALLEIIYSTYFIA